MQRTSDLSCLWCQPVGWGWFSLVVGLLALGWVPGQCWKAFHRIHVLRCSWMSEPEPARFPEQGHTQNTQLFRSPVWWEIISLVSGHPSKLPLRVSHVSANSGLSLSQLPLFLGSQLLMNMPWTMHYMLFVMILLKLKEWIIKIKCR